LISMAKPIRSTDFKFPGQKNIYRGKVRDVYNIDDDYLVMVASDRISAFDVVLPEGIPYKGQVLNQIATMFLENVSDIVPVWNIASPDPNVTVGYNCQPYPVEMIVRGYLTGSSWRLYRSGAREICGIPLPEGMREHQRFEKPLLTPTTKAEQGRHDEDISHDEIIRRGLVPEDEYRMLEDYSMRLFLRGSHIAAERGLILVDTKYEFGKRDGKIFLIDEIHTPDSSRYFYSEGYEERFARGEQQRQLSKEFVREWLMAGGFQGRSGEKVPEMTEQIVSEISDRYIELYENITGRKFVKVDTEDPLARIEKNVATFLSELKKA
jgi:phosphoribosylaminoimidazole-succinocarboxamide synthase